MRLWQIAALVGIAAAGREQIVLSTTQPSSSIRAYTTRADLCNGIQGFSGYVDTVDDRHIYYWAFPSANEPSTDPVILWLSGGPGASGVTFGALSELGPCIYTESGTVANPYSWHKNATVIFVDQPVNIGYSYSRHNVSTLAQSTADLYDFLATFMHDLPQYSQQPFYIAGESYGASYVPALAKTIVENNNKEEEAHRINLQGILIGNGLFRTEVQRAGFYDLGCSPGIIGPEPLLSKALCQEMRDSMPRCEELMAECARSEYKDLVACQESDEFCIAHLSSMIDRVGRSPYDIRQRCVPENEGGELCLPPTTLYAWLGRSEVRSGLNVDPGVVYKHISYEMEEAFAANGEIGYPSDFLVEDLLGSGLRVLIYVGNMDWYCNAPGMRYLVDHLDWDGRRVFRDLPFTRVYFGSPGGDGTVWGYHKRYRRLSFFEVEGAGHMAPADKPAEVLEMVQRWMAGDL